MTTNPQSEVELPCPHGRSSWNSCPHCLGINNPVPKEPPVSQSVSELFEGENSSLRKTFETVSQCPCACHQNTLKKPYEHDSKCCDKMNGAVSQSVEWEKEFDYFWVGRFPKLPSGDLRDAKHFFRTTLSTLVEKMEGLKGKSVCRNPACGKENHPCENTVFNAGISAAQEVVKKIGV